MGLISFRNWISIKFLNNFTRFLIVSSLTKNIYSCEKYMESNAVSKRYRLHFAKKHLSMLFRFSNLTGELSTFRILICTLFIISQTGSSSLRKLGIQQLCYQFLLFFYRKKPFSLPTGLRNAVGKLGKTRLTSKSCIKGLCATKAQNPRILSLK